MKNDGSGRRFSMTLLTSVLLFTGLLASACVETTDNIEWKWQFNVFGYDDAPAAEFFLNGVIPNVEERTNGEFQIVPYFAKDLGLDASNYPKALATGMIDMAWVYPGYFSSDVPTIQICMLWMMYRDFESYKVASDLAKPYHQKGYDRAYRNTVKLGAVGPYNWVIMATREPLPCIRDWSGLKIRVPDDASQRSLKAMGATGVIIPWVDSVPAVHQGLVDGVCNSLDEMTKLKFYEMTDHLYLFNMLSAEHHTLISNSAFEKLPSEYREILMDELKKAEEESWSRVIGANPDHTDAIEVWRENGAIIHEITDEDFEYIQNRIKPAWKAQTDLFKEEAPDLLAEVFEALNIE